MSAAPLCSFVLPLVLLAALPAPPPNPPQRLDSRWIDAAPPVVDGDQSEWAGHLTALDGASMSVGLQNDGEFLYLAIAASEPATRELLSRAGFTLWWDPSSRARKASGLVVPPIVTLVAPDRSEDGASRRSAGPVRDVDPIAHLEMVGPREEDRRRLQLTYLQTVGIGAAGLLNQNVLVYELKVPLAAGAASPYALGAPAGAGVGVGIETGRIPKYRPPDDGRRGGGGALGGLGGFGGFGRRGPGRGGSEADDGGEFAARPFQIWLDVRLAMPPRSSP